MPLPPRYLDLLLLLVAERHRVVSREEIHRLVWGGVAVTDGAFTQAIRTLRRALGDDDPRAPLYLRTAARHGYQFVGGGVVEEDDATPLAGAEGRDLGVESSLEGGAPAGGSGQQSEGLPEGGDGPAAASFDARPGPTLEGTSPFGGQAALRGLVGGAMGAATAGITVAAVLGTLLVAAGGAHWRLLPVLGALGAAVGAWGGGLVGAGLALGGTARRWRGLAAVALGAVGGGLAGAIGHTLVGWTMSELLGRSVTALGGAFEGLVLGGAVAAGFVLATRREGTPGGTGAASVLAAALAGAVAAGVLAAGGSRLSGSSLDAIADALKGARFMAPLGTYLGEARGGTGGGAGPATRLAVSLCEGGFFGAGVAAGVRRALTNASTRLYARRRGSQ